MKTGRSVFFLSILIAAVPAVLGSCGRNAPGNPPRPDGESESVKPAEVLSVSISDVENLSNYGIRYYTEAEGTGGAGRSGPGGMSGGIVRETDEPFVITDTGPDGVIPSEIKRPSMYFLFSQPVVPLAELGKPDGNPGFVSVRPPLQGTFRWYGTRLLSFDASQDAIPQHEYVFTFNDDISSLGGKRLSGKREFLFRTEYLALSDWYPGTSETDRPPVDDVPPGSSSQVTLVFNHPVNLNVIKEYIGIEAKGFDIPFTVERSQNTERRLSAEETDRTAVVRTDSEFSPGTDVTITIREGARSERDMLGIPEPITVKFSTLKPFRFTASSSRSWEFPNDGTSANPVFLEFSHPVDPDTLEGAVHTVPSMDVGAENLAVAGGILRIDDLPVKYDSTYTVRIDPTVKDIYGRPLPGPLSIAVDVGPAARYAFFPNTGSRMLESVFPPKTAFEFQNVYDGVWKIDAIGDPYSSIPASALVPYDASRVPRNVHHFEVVDLSPYLNDDGKGTVGISWNFGEKDKKGKRPDWNLTNLQIQVTDLGLTTRYASNRVIALVTSLSTGKPVEGAEVALMSVRTVKKTAVTGKDGLAVFTLGPGEYKGLFGVEKNPWEDTLRFRVKKGTDSVEFVPNHSHNIWHFGIYSWTNPVQAGDVRPAVFTFTDRGLYRPGEAVTFRGIDRNRAMEDYAPYVGPYAVNLKEPGYRGKTIASVSGITSASGGFYGVFGIPESAPPGNYSLEYVRNGVRNVTEFQVANFERLSFTATVKKPDAAYFSGDTLRFTVSASYLSGGPLFGGTYSAYWTKEPSYFRPAGDAWKTFVFGPESPDQRFLLGEVEGVLNTDGSFVSSQETSLSGIAGLAYRYMLEAEISDVSNRQVAARAEAVVHPASFYIGAKFESDSTGWWSTFVEKGKNVNLEYALVAPDGSLYSSGSGVRNLKVELYHEDWKLAQQQGVSGRINTRYERVDELEHSQEGRINGSQGKVTIRPEKSGSYYVKLTSSDESGREAVTKISFYATGSDWIRWAEEGSTDIGLTAEKPLYAPGETARVLMRTPLPEGRYLVTIEREGIFEERIVRVKGSTHLLEIPVRESYLPIVYVAVSSYSVRSGPPKNTYFEPDLDKPKGYFGIVALNVETKSRTIDLEVTPSMKVYRPGDDAEVTIRAAHNGRPAPGVEVTFMAVDRGVVDLIGYRVPDPARFFYGPDKFPFGVGGADSRSLLMDPVTYEVRDLPGGDSDDAKLKERKDFRPTAVFEPFLLTGNDGTVKVRFRLPDTLTTYRLTAVAVKENSFGLAEEELQARNPINVSSAVPGTLRERDTAFAGVIVTNLDSVEHTLTVAAESDLLLVEGKNSVSLTVDAGSTVNLPFQLAAPVRGRGTVAFTITSGILSERVVDTVEVVLPAVYETVATIGNVKAADPESGGPAFAEEGIVLPSGVPSGLSSLTVTMNTSRLALLTGAFEYLLRYPYGCFEQRASRLMPLVVFRNSLEPLGIAESTGNARDTVAKELELWSGYQNADGGFPFWPGSGGGSSFYVSLRIAHVLALAVKNGFALPERLNLGSLVSFLVKKTEPTFRGESAVKVSPYHAAYAAYVRALLKTYGNPSAIKDELAGLLRSGDELGISGYGFVGLAYLELGLREGAQNALSRMKRFIRPGTGTLDLTETEESERIFDSGVERLSLLLMLWNLLDPENDMVTRAYATLVSRQKSGYWKNTADTNWAVLAVSELMNTEEKERGSLTASVSVSGNVMAEKKFEEAPLDTFVKTWAFGSPELSGVPRDSLQPLSFSAAGRGTLYYAAALQYAVPPEIAPARDEGLGIYTETYDMSGNRIDGNILEPGTTYRLKAVLSTPKARTFVAVRIPVPSGTEILDASFVTTSRRGTEEFLNEENNGGITEGTDDPYVPPVRQEILKNEVRFFIDDLPQGKREMEFRFRTVTGGVYPTPPAVAECMYEPEVFGRTAGRLLFIDPRR